MLIDTQKIQGIKRYVTEALNTIQPEGFWNDFLLLVTAVECLQEENEDLRAVSAQNVKVNKFLKRVADAAQEYREAETRLAVESSANDGMTQSISAARKTKSEKKQALYDLLDEGKRLCP